MNRHNTLKIMRWEFFKNIKSPTFLALTLMVPVIMLASGVIGYFASHSAAREEQAIAVIDETGELFHLLEAHLAATPVTITEYAPAQRDELTELVKEGDYNGYLHLTAESVAQGSVNYYVKDTREQNTMVISGAVSSVITLYRMEKVGLTREQISTVSAPVVLQNRALTGEEASIASLLVPIAFSVILIFAAMFTGQVLMYGVIKEKRNRIVEILLSSVSALDLLLGKLLGFAALGVIQIAIWLVVGLTVVSRFFDLRQVSLTFADLAPSIAFFLGGYLLFAALFAALGATMKDAEGGSQTQGMVILIPMIPIFAASGIMMSPNALWVRVLSFLPPFIPVTMLLRLASTTVPWWEIAVTLVVLILSVYLFVYLGARIFSRGILQFERNLSFKDIRRMLKKDY